MNTGEIRFETTRVYGRGFTQRWAARAFIADPKCIDGETSIARYDAEASRYCRDYMGVWDTNAYGCTDTHAIEQFKVEYAPEIEEARRRALSYNWPKKAAT